MIFFKSSLTCWTATFAIKKHLNILSFYYGKIYTVKWDGIDTLNLLELVNITKAYHTCDIWQILIMGYIVTMKHNASICGSVVGSSFCRLLSGNKKKHFFLSKTLIIVANMFLEPPEGPGPRRRCWQWGPSSGGCTPMTMFTSWATSSTSSASPPLRTTRTLHSSRPRFSAWAFTTVSGMRGRALLNAHSWGALTQYIVF